MTTIIETRDATPARGAEERDAALPAEGRHRGIVWALTTLGVADGVAVIVLDVVNGLTLQESVEAYSVASVLFAWTFVPVAALILRRHPRHPIGWLMMWIGVFTPAQVIAAQVATAMRPPGATTFAELGLVAQVLEWLPIWAWALTIFPFMTLLPLLFPDGRLPSRRWRPVAVAAVVVTLAITLGFAGGYWAWHPDAVLEEQPIPWTPIGRLLDVAFPAFGLVAIACVAAVVVRYRRAVGTERQQIKVLLFAVAVTMPVATVSLLAIQGGNEVFLSVLGISLMVIPIPVAMGVAILRHRLFDVDVVINRTIVFAALAGFITVLYAVVVVGLGSLLPTSDLVLSMGATAVVAVAFEPVRSRVQHWANRAVFGQRATPYEVLARMTSRVGEAMAAEDALADAAALLREGTGAARAAVWMLRDGALRPVATSPDAEREPVAAAGDGLPVVPGADLVVPVRHEGELVGALSISKRPGEGVSTADRRLVDELAGQAALLMATTRLRDRLQERAAQLRESRRRLVAAQDHARRDLERNLHDGAQQELVALKIKLGLTRTIAEREGVTDLGPRLERAGTLADETVDALRELARGIYPPLLESEGLAAALTAQARKIALPVAVLDRGTGRQPRAVEATAYFCALEALGNAERHADARTAQVTLEQPEEGLVVLTITDDGCGYDPEVTPSGGGLTHMADRVDAAGGQMQVTSRPGQGTSVRITLPTAEDSGQV